MKPCRRCGSGYEVDIEAGHKYCGFCGARVMSVSVESLTSSGPFYLDTNEPIRMVVRIINQSVSDVKIEVIDIE